MSAGWQNIKMQHNYFGMFVICIVAMDTNSSTFFIDDAGNLRNLIKKGEN